MANAATAPDDGEAAGDDGFNHPGKHGRDDSDTRENSVADSDGAHMALASPKKKARLEDGVNGDTDVDADAEGDATHEEPERNPGEAVPAKAQPDVTAFLAAMEAELRTEGAASTPKLNRRNPRASSQPAREERATATRAGRNSRATSKEPTLQRKTRAGSAEIPSGLNSRKPPSGRGRTAAAPPAARELGWAPYGSTANPAAAGANGDAAQYAIPGPSTAARPATIAEESEVDDGEPPLLKPLTHFDSGIEFFGTVSKQGYKSDWHEGLVLDDPVDAETLRRGQALMAEESLGGRYLNPPSPSAAMDAEQAYGSGVPVGPHPSHISEDDERVMGELLGHVNFPMLPHTHGY